MACNVCVCAGSPQFDGIFEQCSKAILPGHALLLTMHIINHTLDVEIQDEKVRIIYSEVISGCPLCKFNQRS